MHSPINCSSLTRNFLAFIALAAFLKNVEGTWEPCNGVSGTCIDVRSSTCTVGTLTGRCPGASNNRCCPASGGVSSARCTAQNGLCKRTATCSNGRALTGFCPGPSSVTCCVPNSPSSGFASTIVSVAQSEYAQWGNKHECNNRPMSGRIKTYWAALGMNLDGCNRDVPWSAAFISYMVRQAGGGSKFRYSSAHRVYIHDAFAGGRGLYNSVRNTRTSTIKTGDMVCAGRGRVNSWKYANFRDWYRKGGIKHDSIPTHCDIVTNVNGNSITVIGGNVNQRVTRKTVAKSTYAVVLRVTRS